MNRLSMLTAAALAAGLATGAQAQEIAGDWIGAVQTPVAELTITLHVQQGANGALEGYAGSPDQSPNPLPMADIVMKDGALTFAVPIVRGTYAGKWEAATRRWVGTFTQASYDMPLTLAHGNAPPRPTVTGLDGDWAGVLATPMGELRVVLKVKTGPDGTIALFASPDQGPAEMLAAVSHQGDAVGFQLKGIGGFDGKLSADGKTMDGEWKQGGFAMPLVMKKSG